MIVFSFWISRRSNLLILKEISPEYSSEGLMLNLKLQYFGHLMQNLKRPWCWERLKVGGEGDDRGWDGWMGLLTQWTRVWVNSGSWRWTGRPGVLQSMGSQRVGHDWVTKHSTVHSRSVQSLSRVRLFATPWIAARQASLSITNSWSPPTNAYWFGDATQPPYPLSSPSPPPLILPSISVFSNESALRIRWPKYWSFSFSIGPSNEYSVPISFRMDWLDLLAVQGTLKSLLQHHSSKASILRLSAFFIVQLSHPYMTTGKTLALTRQNFVGKVMSLLCNMLSRLIIVFLPRSKYFFLISWLQSPSAVILKAKKIKSVTVSIVSPFTCHEVMGTSS